MTLDARALVTEGYVSNEGWNPIYYETHGLVGSLKRILSRVSLRVSELTRFGMVALANRFDEVLDVISRKSIVADVPDRYDYLATPVKRADEILDETDRFDEEALD